MSLLGLFALLSLYIFDFFGELSLFLIDVTEVAKLCSKLGVIKPLVNGQ